MRAPPSTSPLHVSARRRGRRWVAVLAVASALLAVSDTAVAGNILRRGSGGSGSPGSATAGAAAAQASQTAQAAALALQAQSPLRQALDAVRQWQAKQDAARAAAAATVGGIPDGLTPGGLYLSPEDVAPIGASAPTQTTQNGVTSVTVVQKDPRAILTWGTFNVGSATELYFNQTAGGDAAKDWVALNRVNDPLMAPSKILGSIRAEGQVYVINRNGILFGGSSQVNVGTLVASGLDISSATPFASSSLYNLSFAVPAGQTPGDVTVEAGAKLAAASGGRVMLLGGQVVNGGSIEVADGQVVLAAGSAMTLAQSADKRGVAVALTASHDGSAANVVENTGLISTPRGNITMVGGQALQNGLLTATTGAQANGSIVLGADGFITSLGEGSITQILPDTGGKKVIGSGSDFLQSTVDVRGDKIDVLDGAIIYAPSGKVTLTAVMTAPKPASTDPTVLDDTRVYVGSGARIDVSGLRDVDVAMDQNVIKAELRANELRDNPLLRDGALRSQTVYFDGRLGVTVAVLSGYYDLVERDVTQLMTSGGSVQLAANQIITRQGSTIDLSGGSLRYQAGWVRTSALIDASGRRVSIEDAVPGVVYVGIGGDFVVSHPRWGVTETYSSGLTPSRARYEQGYVQGGSAGQLSLTTNAPRWYSSDPATNTTNTTDPVPPNPSATGAVRILDGDVVASTISGPNQRQLPTAKGSTDPTQVWRQQPQGAILTVSGAGDVTFARGGPQLDGSFGPETRVDPSQRYQMQLPARWFDGTTFKTVAITSGSDPNVNYPSGGSPGTYDRAPGGHLDVPGGVVVNLGDGGSFSFAGKAVDIEGAIFAPGGNVSVQALNRGSDGSAFGTVHLGATGVIDVAGRLSNDALDGPAGPLRALNGGTVSAAGAQVLLDQGSLIDVSGGAHLDATGSKLAAGNGGSIKLDVSRYPAPTDPSAAQAPSDGKLVMDGALRGYAIGQGGLLTIVTGSDVVITAAPPPTTPSTTYVLTPQFFTQGGFASYSVVGERSVTVKEGTLLAPSAETLDVPDRVGELPSGTRLDDVATREVLPEGQRHPMTLSLSTIPARIIANETTTSSYPRQFTLEQGVTIRMDPGSSVRLGSEDNLMVDGTIDAPGGAIGLTSKEALGGGVVVGADAQLLASGYVQTKLVKGQSVRSVQPGGSVTISGLSVAIAPGAVIDVSGVHGTADLPSASGSPSGSGVTTYAPVAVDGSAGQVSISAGRGSIAGTFKLGAGGDSGVGGSLRIESANGAPMVVTQAAPTAAVMVDGNPSLTVGASSLDASGADDLTLQVPQSASSSFTNANALLFDGNVDLQARRSLTLLAPILGTIGVGPSNVTLSAEYVALVGGSSANPKVDAYAANLDGTLTVKADLIDVSRLVLLGCVDSACTQGGFAAASFVASGDIRLSDHDASGNAADHPGLLSAGALEFRSAQVYVTSREQRGAALERAPGDPGFLVSSAQKISIVGNGNDAPVPLSFGERLTLQAPAIDQAGVLRAPQGQIFLVGTGDNGSVTLEPGSLTSASLQGATVPFGEVQTGGVFLGYDQAGQAPTKAVNVSAPNIAVRGGAVVDVSGGGDLLGYLFVPGNGGSKDVLSASGGFAVLPSLGTAPAPMGGTSSLRDAGLNVGDRIWLQGVPGLKDGYYTLLPAHYALLPGGLLVEPLGGTYASPLPTSTRADGAVVVSGYMTGSGKPGYGRFAVLSQAVFERYSALDASSFDAFAAALASDAGVAVRTPNDAGAVALDAQQSLVLDGTGRFEGGQGGLLGNLDVSAPKIAVVGANAAAPDATYLVLDPTALTGFGAGSVLLGGTRAAAAAGGTAVTVNAQDVYVATGGTPWTGPEIILAASDKVTIADGSVLHASGGGQLDPSALNLTGDGALLRVSAGSRVPVVRTIVAAGAGGTLGVEGTATVTAAGSIALDGSAAIALSPAATLTGPQLDLASVRVNLGDAPANAPGVTLSADRLTSLGAGADLLIRGDGSIQIYGAFTLGSRDGAGAATVHSLTLDSGLVQGNGSAGTSATIVAGDLTLRNSGAAAGAVQGTPGAGGLALDVDTLHLGPGKVQLAGFGALGGSAGVIEASGSGELEVAGSLSLATSQVRSASGAAYAVNVTGDVALTHGAGPSSPTAATNLGGQLALQGASVLVDTAIALPAGTFQATAVGGALTVGANAVLDVHGEAIDFQDGAQFAPGGSIQLSAAHDLAIQAGAVIDVSGSARGGDAGRIGLTAGGQVTVDSDLRGSAAAGAAGGSFALNGAAVGWTGGFSALNAKLESGGFDTARDIQLSQQGIALAAGESIHAHEVVLRSDGGQVQVAGVIDAAGTASSPSGGRVQLVGGQGVSVTSTARLDARAGDAPAGGFVPSSGKVELVATGGTVDVAAGAVIDVSGGRSGGGSVVVRAPQAGSDVAVNELAGDFVGAREVLVQAVHGYQGTVVDATLASTLLRDASTWQLANGTAVHDRLAAANPSLAGVLQVGAGAVVTSASDLSIQSNVAVNGALGAGYLGFVAAGSIDVKATVSDGFALADRTAALSSGRSSSLGFEAGGDITLEPGTMIRTGTGDISMHAGRDISFTPPTTGAPAVVYTAGTRTATSGQFLGAPTGMPLGEFPTGGGDVELSAGRDIRGVPTTQTTSAWLFRYGDSSWNDGLGSFTVNQQTSWSVYYQNFEQGVGALGGGDVCVSAGRGVDQLQVAIPTTGFQTTKVGAASSDADVVVRGGGDLHLVAGGDIVGGLFVLGRGQANLLAGGSVAKSDSADDPRGLRVNPGSSAAVGASANGVGVLFGLMDATATVTAGAGAYIEGAFDPARQGQIAANMSGVPGQPQIGSAFWGYTSRTALSVTSLSGDVKYENDPWASVDVSTAVSLSNPYYVAMSGTGTTALNDVFSRAPPKLSLTSLASSVYVEDHFGGGSTLNLASSPSGTLEVRAGEDVHLVLTKISMDEIGNAYTRGPGEAFATNWSVSTGAVTSVNAASQVTADDASTNFQRGFTPIHAGDSSPVLIEALEGSVCGQLSGSCTPDLSLAIPVVVPKPIEVVAGRDVVGGQYQPQNNGPDDVSIIQAGRDIQQVNLLVTGEGAAVLQAGRDVVLRQQQASPLRGGSLYSLGNRTDRLGVGINEALKPNKGADLYVLAGAADGVDYEAFAAAYLDPASTRGVVRTYLPELGVYMTKLGFAALPPEALVAAFQALPLVQREMFLDRVFFEELKATGLDYNDATGPRYHSYDRGFRAVSTLFPTDPASLGPAGGGDVILSAKPVETQSGGDITVLAPYGNVLVGTDVLPKGVDGAAGGIVTRRGGDIRIMADGDIALFTSRVFTLEGGDITMWTTDGSITAGAGSKTAVLKVPLKYNMSPAGVVTFDAFGFQTGAGIGVLDALGDATDRPQSRLDLLAPRGEVNAGDAGIRVVGDLNIAAQVVVGVENIQATGTSTGVPHIEAPNIGALTTASQVTQAASKEGVTAEATAAARNTLADLPSIITVDVVGYETTDSGGGPKDEAPAKRTKRP